MKKILSILAVFTALLTSHCAFAQAPVDLSFLTNRASLASWALKQVDEIEVSVTQSASGGPEMGNQYITKSFDYSGPPSLFAMAKSLKGQEFVLPTPIPASITVVSTALKNKLPDGNTQYLFSGAASGKAEFDGKNWVLPKEASEPPMYLSYSIFIPAPGVTKAWVVETNQWGWAVKKSLSLWFMQGFYFETSLAGEAYLCLEFGSEKGDGETEQWVYDLRNGGMRSKLPAVIAKVSIRDSEDVREFGDNTPLLWFWVYTYKPGYSDLTYGKVPLLVANYTKEVSATIWVGYGSIAGYARSFSVTRISNVPGVPDEKSTLTVPSNQNSVDKVFKPGLYHIIPLGIDVCPDWWKITEVDGWSYGKGTAVVAP